MIASALAVGGYLVGRDSVDAPPPPPPEAPAPVKQPKPAVVPEILLQRADLIRLASAAADALAGGPAITENLAGRRFAIRIPFGCGGPSDDSKAPFGWRYDAGEETLRVQATPQQWVDVPWVAERLEDREIESVEGYWMPRPWTRSEACPVEEPADLGQRSSSLGIARFFGADSSRIGQSDGKSLRLVERVPPEELKTGAGFHLLLEGRIAQVPGGDSTVLCHAADAYDRPTCLISAEFERIAIENPATGDLLAEWEY